MAGALERFLEAAAGLGITPEVREFPEGTRTAAEAAAAVGCDIGQIVKSLVFMTDGEPLLALTSGANRADLAKLRALSGAREVRKADADEARAATGFAIGGTPPFGHPQRLRVLVDRDLLGYEVIWAAAGTPRGIFPIPPDELLRVSQGEPAELKET